MLTTLGSWDQGTTAAIKMPSFFKETGYRQPEDPRNGLFQYGIGTDKEAFEYWSTMPDVVDNFNTCMTGIRGSRPSWIEWFPVRERILGLELTSAGSDVLLVDIAGGRGHDVQAFGRKFEDVQGRLVLQDLPAVIGDIQHLDDRVERLEYDFFTEQPIKGQYTCVVVVAVQLTAIKERVYTSSTSSCTTGPMKYALVFFLELRQL